MSPTPKGLRALADVGESSGFDKVGTAHWIREAADRIEALEAAASVPPPADAEGIAIGWAVRGSEWDVATLETDEFQDADDAINFAQGLARKYPGDGWRAYEIRLVPAVPSSKEPTE